jgi:hypothetical protein
VAIVGGATLALTVAFAMSNGPHLAAAPHGIWVRDWKWRTRRAFLPWTAVDHADVARPFLWRVVFVSAPVEIAAGDVHVLVDARERGMLFTASPFFCGRRADAVLAELVSLSGGRVGSG